MDFCKQFIRNDKFSIWLPKRRTCPRHCRPSWDRSPFGLPKRRACPRHCRPSWDRSSFGLPKRRVCLRHCRPSWDRSPFGLPKRRICLRHCRLPAERKNSVRIRDRAKKPYNHLHTVQQTGIKSYPISGSVVTVGIRYRFGGQPEAPRYPGDCKADLRDEACRMQNI